MSNANETAGESEPLIDDPTGDTDFGEASPGAGAPPLPGNNSGRQKTVYFVSLAGLLALAYGVVTVVLSDDKTPDQVAQEATGLSSQVDQPFAEPFVGVFRLPKEETVEASTTQPLRPQVTVMGSASPVMPVPAVQPAVVSKAEQQKQAAAAQLWEKRRRASSVVFDTLTSAKAAAPAENNPGAERAALMNKMLSQVKTPATQANVFPGSSPLKPGRRRLAGDDNSLGNRLQPSTTVTVEAGLLKNPSSTLTQGTLIACTLETAINSTLPGMTRCVVSEDAYSFDGSYKLVSKGSQLTGQYEGGIQQGETRVFVIWQRLLTPQGISVTLDSPSTDTLGRSGQSAVVDSKFFKRFGSSALLSIIGGVAATKGDNEVVLRATADSFNRSAEIALKNSINIPPEARINQGQRIKIFVARDVDFRPVLTLARKVTP